MADFPTAVAPPGGASYSAPLLSFQQFSNWAADDPYKKVFDQQQQQLNNQRLQSGQQQLDLSKAFPQGLPIDPKTGQIDYAKAASVLATKGGIGTAIDLMQAQPAPLSPLFGGAPQPQGGGANGAPASPPAPSQPQPSPNSPKGDSGSGTVASLVTDLLPNQDTATGQTIAKVAQTLGVDPNAQLTPGQLRRAQVLAQRYASASGGDTAAGAGGSRLPPSANAGTPAAAVAPAAPASFNDRFTGGPAAQPQPAAQPRPQPAPIGAPAQPTAQPQPAPQAAAQPQPGQQPQGGPLVPQVPLPKGFTDPQQAILALRTEAARLSGSPRAQGQVQELNNWASRIEESIKPLSVGPSTTIVDPRTGQPLFQGAALSGAGGPSSTLDADAERYRQSGKLPPNMGRGIQGEMESKRIRARAAELEIGAGGDPAQWSTKWQDYNAAGIGKNAGERVRANREENLNLILKATDAAIPAALEANKNLPRSAFVPLNRLIQKGEVMSSDPRLVEFGMANLQLAEHWARAMNPTGVMRESDRDKALHFLDTAYSANTYERAVNQLKKQITRERDAVRGGDTILKGSNSPEPGEEGKTAKPDADGWVKMPNGVKIREVN